MSQTGYKIIVGRVFGLIDDDIRFLPYWLEYWYNEVHTVVPLCTRVTLTLSNITLSEQKSASLSDDSPTLLDTFLLLCYSALFCCTSVRCVGVALQTLLDSLPGYRHTHRLSAFFTFLIRCVEKFETALLCESSKIKNVLQRRSRTE